ncbi:TIGR02678 family protein [Modestobacter sp. I12A-02628]|uniref:TIGR02678 family protein n=1 Tax=Goekera deserti TaxID=2497753 RepID=A0A7K3WFU0_9ACTN|nr:TIGR02678 family protein [Goekera deserti]MPQ96457.1 TIGR02678 family protein [Goekera deserti]NDI47228.1 TIGR02678 family protein [Goekera deserti]NEL55371.1 TIGR02678 family protein [Goekera deserti]
MSRSAVTTSDHDAAERRTAARALLATPVLTTARHPETMRLVRRHATGLRVLFATQLGYQLVVESTFARLLKTPPAPGFPAAPARRADRTPFTTRSYVHLCLVGAALLAPSSGEQVLLSSLIEQVRADAAGLGLDIPDTLAERRSLVAALDLLVRWGVLTETDGSTSNWAERKDEALLTVHRPLLPHLLTGPLPAQLDAPTLLAGTADDPPRRRLRRVLAEHPVVPRETLDPETADVLSRERRELARQLDEAFGLVLETRAEGVLAHDPEASLSDLTFPGTGTVPQAALLLVEHLVIEHLPDPDARDATGAHPASVAVPWAAVDAGLAHLLARYGRGWERRLREDPPALRAAVLDLLTSLSLTSVTGDGVLLHAVAARYRTEVTHHRAAARPEPPPVDEPGLFDLDPEGSA